ncbi:NAD(P)/FAD-dependent oxidoreductase [Pseudonocardia sp. T1-2H]|uniref:NAD(P)/FAD-dependent oxidoreductase n=1 Tax=Pseudonocardia sp. T1-2H TaxID=3128899 RepID=UPI00310164B5
MPRRSPATEERSGTPGSPRRGEKVRGSSWAPETARSSAPGGCSSPPAWSTSFPDLSGLRELWGRDVLHCPYCHGHEVRDQAIGVLGTGPLAVHQALLFRQWSADVTLFRHTSPDPTEAEQEQLAARGVAVVEGEVVALESTGGRLSGVRLDTGRVVPRSAVTVTPRFAARSAVLAGLGITAVEHPRGVGSHVDTDPSGLTAVPGVWAAGNVADLMIQVVGSAAAGVTAGAAINADLVAEDTRLAVERWRSRRQDPFSPEAEARMCEQLVGDRRHGL